MDGQRHDPHPDAGRKVNPRTPSRRSLDVFAHVFAEAPAGRLTLKGAGRSIGISGGSWYVYRDLVTSLRRRSRSERHELLTRLGRVLQAAGLELSFHIDHREIARVGGGSGTGLVARVLALPGVKIRVDRLLAALLRSPIETRSAA